MHLQKRNHTRSDSVTAFSLCPWDLKQKHCLAQKHRSMEQHGPQQLCLLPACSLSLHQLCKVLGGGVALPGAQEDLLEVLFNMLGMKRTWTVKVPLKSP